MARRRERADRFAVRSVAVPPGAAEPFDARQWHDELVLVVRGEIELVAADGTGRPFPRGSVLCLAGLRLRALRNHGSDAAVLLAVRRR